MQTECTPSLFEFEAVGRRAVVAQFDGGTMTSNAGALLLRQVDRGLGRGQNIRRLASGGYIAGSESRSDGCAVGY